MFVINTNNALFPDHLRLMDPRFTDLAQLAEIFGPKQKKCTHPHKYEDSRVTDMLKSGATVDGSNASSKRFRNLLRAIRRDWRAEHPDDRDRT